jgi:hypothetical protein
MENTEKESEAMETASGATEYAFTMLKFVRDLFVTLIKGILFYVLLLPPTAVLLFLLIGYLANGNVMPKLYYTIPVAILIVLAAVVTGTVLGFDRAVARLTDALGDLVSAKTWQVTQALVPKLKETSSAVEIETAVKEIAENPPATDLEQKEAKGLLRRTVSGTLDKVIWGGIRYSLQKDFVSTVTEAMESAGDDSCGYSSGEFVKLAQEQLVVLTIERITFIFHLRNILVGGAFVLLVLLLSLLPALV